MAGAYVAKPAVVSVPDVPPGWDDDWPIPGETGYDPDPFFPAPFPPGYATSYSIVTTATASIAPTDTASATSSVRDQSTYATNEPSVITWTATIDGSAIDLKFDGGSFASSISESAVFGTYWGTTPDIIFDLDDTNNEDTVVLKALCTLLNSEGQVEVLTDTSDITISAAISMSFSLTVSGLVANDYPLTSWLAVATIDNEPPESQYGMSDIRWNSSGGYTIDETERGGAICTQNTSTNKITISIDELEAGTFDVWYHVGTWGHQATFNLSITIDGVVYTKQIVQNADRGPEDEQLVWLTFDGTTGEVTLVNP